ncbi:hypothetical protein EJB05_40657, partial [Eragrostis curvula]
MHPTPKPSLRMPTIALMSASMLPRSSKALGVAAFQDSSDCLNSIHFLCSKLAAMDCNTGSSTLPFSLAPPASFFKAFNSCRTPVSRSTTLNRTICCKTKGNRGHGFAGSDPPEVLLRGSEQGFGATARLPNVGLVVAAGWIQFNRSGGALGRGCRQPRRSAAWHEDAAGCADAEQPEEQAALGLDSSATPCQ